MSPVCLILDSVPSPSILDKGAAIKKAAQLFEQLFSYWRLLKSD
jgi:hypothetical protein